MNKIIKMIGKGALLTAILASALLITSSVKASDYSTPHTFKPGDVISADMMNEIFSYIRAAKATVTESDLIGTWTCNATASVNDVSGSLFSASGWTAPSHGFFYSSGESTVTFTDNGDNTYTVSTPAPDPIELRDSSASTHDGDFIVENNILYYEMNENPSQVGQAVITQISNDRYMFSKNSSLNRQPLLMTCDRASVPPAKVTTLAASKSGQQVSLSWTDVANETGYKVYRLNPDATSYTLLSSSVSQDSTSYTDTLPETAGYYNYYIKATNAAGDSYVSNIVQVEVE